MAKRKRSLKAASDPPANDLATRVEVTVDCPVHESFRVAQVAGMFDVPLAAKARETFIAPLPARDELIAGADGVPRRWQIGVIVGPSGSGKSTIARAAFGEQLYSSDPVAWPADRAVVDCFPDQIGGSDVSIRDITALLTSVGFSTPPAWIKPYQVLSNGERFRCDLARALIAGGNPIVFDEFTSVVDRTVAKTGSVAVAKHVRRQPDLQFIAVTCHYDIVPWLEPDWVLDMASCQLARGQLRRPTIDVELFRTGRAAWQLFKKTHYLSGTIPGGCRLYVAMIDGQPAALVVTASVIGDSRDPHRQRMRRISRLVVLPDYQGIGLGGRVLDAVAELLAAEGLVVSIKSGHPSMIAMLKRAALWKIVKVHKGDSPRACGTFARRKGGYKSSHGRFVVAARYLPPAAEKS